MKRRRTLAVIVVAITGLAAAVGPAEASDAEDTLGNWLIYNGTLRFGDRWSIFTDAQIRFFEPAGDLEEFLLRAAGHYDITPKMTVGLGYLNTNVWSYEGGTDAGRIRTEDRIYQQFVYRHRWGRALIEHRVRLEQRWIDEFGDSEFATRERYRFQTTIPINRTAIEPGTNFVNLYNEFFLNQGGEQSLEQNRLYAAWGRQFTAHSNLQLGLLWQHRSPGGLLQAAGLLHPQLRFSIGMV